jgi:hypothetical protein
MGRLLLMFGRGGGDGRSVVCVLEVNYRGYQIRVCHKTFLTSSSC